MQKFAYIYMLTRCMDFTADLCAGEEIQLNNGREMGIIERSAFNYTASAMYTTNVGIIMSLHTFTCTLGAWTL